jgi:hypothetical protein
MIYSLFVNSSLFLFVMGIDILVSLLECVCHCDFIDNKYDFKPIVEHKLFGNCVFKNCDLKT